MIKLYNIFNLPPITKIAQPEVLKYKKNTLKLKYVLVGVAVMLLIGLFIYRMLTRSTQALPRLQRPMIQNIIITKKMIEDYILDVIDAVDCIDRLIGWYEDIGTHINQAAIDVFLDILKHANPDFINHLNVNKLDCKDLLKTARPFLSGFTARYGGDTMDINPADIAQYCNIFIQHIKDNRNNSPVNN